MGLRSELTGKNYKKVKRLWSDCSDDIGVFPNLSNIDKSDIEGETGMKLATSISVFGFCIIRQTNTVLDGKKKLLRSP